MGERFIKITVSDGASQSSIVITIDVQILNNNPPEISFAGSSNVSFVEGSTVPLAIGSILKAVINDADNNDVFLMEYASVQLHEGVVNGLDEVLNYDRDTVEALGIRVDGMYEIINGYLNCIFYQAPRGFSKY